MKKVLLMIYAGLTTLPGMAQVSVGTFAGMHSSLQHSSSYGFKYNASNSGWRAGVMADIGLSKRVSLRPGVLYETHDPRIATADLSLIATYKVHSRKGGFLFASAGPYLAITAKQYDIYLSKAPVTNLYTGVNQLYVYLPPEPIKLLRPSHRGLYGAIGYQLKNGIFALVHYQAIITNMASKAYLEFDPTNKTYIYFSNYGLSVGYSLNLSAKKPVAGK